MAKNLDFTRNIIDKMAIKGTLSDNCAMITYMDEDNNEQTIAVEDCLSPFSGKPINFSISVKTKEDLTDKKDE